jgi:hypothetical protein
MWQKLTGFTTTTTMDEKNRVTTFDPQISIGEQISYLTETKENINENSPIMDDSNSGDNNADYDDNVAIIDEAQTTFTKTQSG